MALNRTRARRSMSLISLYNTQVHLYLFIYLYIYLSIYDAEIPDVYEVAVCEE